MAHGPVIPKVKNSFFCLILNSLDVWAINAYETIREPFDRITAWSVAHGGRANLPPIAAGPFQPDWKSLSSQYQTPDWFRDAKFWRRADQPDEGSLSSAKRIEESAKDDPKAHGSQPKKS